MSGDLRAAVPLVLVGAGKMGGAMLAGWIERGLPKDGVVILDPNPAPEMAALAAEKGLRLETTPPADVTAAVILIAVKPQVMDAVLPTLRGLVGPDTVAVSVAAGKTIASIETGLGARAVVRAMPNTPAQVGRGITACAANAAVTTPQRVLVTALLSAIGKVEWVAAEDLIDAVTAVSGSGPAYVFLLAEVLAEAGRKAGLPADLAARLARATVEGAGELMFQSPLDPATLRKNVTSPNGTTAAALAVLMADDALQPLMDAAVAAAANRSRELSAG